MTAPRANSADSSAWASTSTAWASTPWKIPARVRTSSTSPLLVRPPVHRNGSSTRQSRGARTACAAPTTLFRRAVEDGDGSTRTEDQEDTLLLLPGLLLAGLLRAGR